MRTDMNSKDTSLKSLSSLSKKNPNVPSVVPSANHKVLIKLPLTSEASFCPYPATYEDIWDDYHVCMPNSPHSLISKQSNQPGNEQATIQRWTIICAALKDRISNFHEFRHAILKYNPECTWDFCGLRILLQKEMSKKEHDTFFEKILPGIIDLALSIPDVVTTSLPLLQKQANASITMSQKQVACLLANAFLCTFPKNMGSIYHPSYPSINFSRLFNTNLGVAVEKMKCIIQYFKEMTSNGRNGVITFSRQYISPEDTPSFEGSDKLLSKLHISSNGFIEEATGLLQMDFADKYIGGIVLSTGCVQEEIRFVLCPELIVTRLFTERLDDRDALIITGVEQFCLGTGYGEGFKFKGPFNDRTDRDEFRRRFCQVVAIDALNLDLTRVKQYKPELIMRELIKAYAGFRVLEGSGGSPTAIATGNWGCGVFNGDVFLKSLIQMAAAAESGRDVAYFTFRSTKLRDQIAGMYRYLSTKRITVGQLVKALCRYESEFNGEGIFQFIRSTFSEIHPSINSESSKQCTLF